MKQQTIKPCSVCGLSILAPKFKAVSKVNCKRCDNWLNDALFRRLELPNIANEALRRLECEIASHD